MPRMIQLRHVPESLHRKLKARAAMEGLSLSDYVVREVARLAEPPTRDEMRRRTGIAPVGDRAGRSRDARRQPQLVQAAMREHAGRTARGGL